MKPTTAILALTIVFLAGIADGRPHRGTAKERADGHWEELLNQYVGAQAQPDPFSGLTSPTLSPIRPIPNAYRGHPIRPSITARGPHTA